MVGQTDRHDDDNSCFSHILRMCLKMGEKRKLKSAVSVTRMAGLINVTQFRHTWKFIMCAEAVNL